MAANSFYSTTSRVPDHTSSHANQRIARETENSVTYYAERSTEIDRRLDELDAEWDIERLIEVEAATTITAGIALGAMVDQRWLLVPAFAAGMLLVHNLNGWYPMLPLFRRLGFRTQVEISNERFALMVLRGDFSRRSATRSNGAQGAVAGAQPQGA